MEAHVRLDDTDRGGRVLGVRLLVEVADPDVHAGLERRRHAEARANTGDDLVDVGLVRVAGDVDHVLHLDGGRDGQLGDPDVGGDLGHDAEVARLEERRIVGAERRRGGVSGSERVDALVVEALRRIGSDLRGGRRLLASRGRERDAQRGDQVPVATVREHERALQLHVAAQHDRAILGDAGARRERRCDDGEPNADAQPVAEVALQAEEERVGRHARAVEGVERRLLDAGRTARREDVRRGGAADDVGRDLPGGLLFLLGLLGALFFGLSGLAATGFLGARLVVRRRDGGCEEEGHTDGEAGYSGHQNRLSDFASEFRPVASTCGLRRFRPL